MDRNGKFGVAKAMVIAASLILSALAASADDFPGAGAAIPDNTPAGVNIPFNVSGIPSVGAVRITVNLTHSYVGDLRATLISPGGTAR